MAKRFIDTEVFKTPILRGCPAPAKLLWFYMLCDCNHAGIWNVDYQIAEVYTGCKVNEEMILKYFGDRVHFLDEKTKLFLVDFIKIQYGELKDTNNAHISVVKELKKHKLLNTENQIVEGLTRGCPTPSQELKEAVKTKVNIKDINNEFLDEILDEKYSATIRKWIEYKKQIKDPYKTIVGLRAMYKQLLKMSNNDSRVADEIVEQSMANNWKGLFPLKNNITNNNFKNYGTGVSLKNPISYDDDGL